MFSGELEEFLGRRVTQRPLRRSRRRGGNHNTANEGCGSHMKNAKSRVLSNKWFISSVTLLALIEVVTAGVKWG